MSTTATRTRGMLEVCAMTRATGGRMSGQGDGAVALVTGANRGIGREVARQLAERGYEVLLSARDGEKAAAAARELAESTGASVTPLTLDVADPQSIAAAAERVRADPGTAGRAGQQRGHRQRLRRGGRGPGLRRDPASAGHELLRRLPSDGGAAGPAARERAPADRRTCRAAWAAWRRWAAGRRAIAFRRRR